MWAEHAANQGGEQDGSMPTDQTSMGTATAITQASASVAA